VLEEYGFVEAGEECHDVESEEGGDGSFGVGSPSAVPFGLFPFGILLIQLIGSNLPLHQKFFPFKFSFELFGDEST